VSPRADSKPCRRLWEYICGHCLRKHRKYIKVNNRASYDMDSWECISRRAYSASRLERLHIRIAFVSRGYQVVFLGAFRWPQTLFGVQINVTETYVCRVLGIRLRYIEGDVAVECNVQKIFLNVFLTVHHELTVYWLPTWCTNYYLFIK